MATYAVSTPTLMEHQDDVHDMVYDISERLAAQDLRRVPGGRFLLRDPDGLARFGLTPSTRISWAAVFRTIPSKILTLEQLNAPRLAT